MLPLASLVALYRVERSRLAQEQQLASVTRAAD